MAATCVGTEALGPGYRSVVWVQGCPFSCPGCLAPEWIPRRTARPVDPEQLAAELLADPEVTGLTISGGEPMAQAPALARLVTSARRERELSVVCFSGYTLDELRRPARYARVAGLLGQVDVLIDGRYVAAENDGRGLRGSANQRVHHLTGRLAGSGYDFTGRARTAEIRVRERELLLVGVPPKGLTGAIDESVARLRAAAGEQHLPTDGGSA